MYHQRCEQERKKKWNRKRGGTKDNFVPEQPVGSVESMPHYDLDKKVNNDTSTLKSQMEFTLQQRKKYIK